MSAEVKPNVPHIYTADGEKVRTTYYDATGSQTLQIDYLGNYILRNGEVDRILTPSGYIKNDTVYSYVKDYQGNIRSVVRQDGAVVESTDYYPYGTPFTTAGAVQPYKYGTKELDRMHGLDLYDSQARWYDSLLGRTTTMDPKAEKYYNLSPYTWCAGNPLKFVDPDGNVICIVCSDGSILFDNLSDESKQTDKLEILNDEGKTIASLSFKLGTIEKYDAIDNGGNGIDIINIRGDENGEKFFEMLSDNISKNTNIEFALLQIGERGDNGLNYVTTSHEVGRESSLTKLYDKELKKEHNFRKYAHSHPKGSNAGGSDRLTKFWITQKRKSSGLSIPKFLIYNVQQKIYISY
ncbi:MAG: JAB-like toxin 1 domain-containing protein [Muribaculaceae bacterium]